MTDPARIQRIAASHEPPMTARMTPGPWHWADWAAEFGTDPRSCRDYPRRRATRYDAAIVPE